MKEVASCPAVDLFFLMDKTRFVELANNKTEQELLSMNGIGFEGYGGFSSNPCQYYINLIPSMECGYWHTSVVNMEDNVVEESKKPMTLLGFFNIFIRAGKIKVLNLQSKKIAPVDGFAYSDQNKQDKTNVYIIQSDIGGPVKIGKANDVTNRIEMFQMGCPFKLVVVRLFENTPINFEGDLHKKYKEYRLHGEWFSEDILKQIDQDLGAK